MPQSFCQNRNLFWIHQNYLSLIKKSTEKVRTWTNLVIGLSTAGKPFFDTLGFSENDTSVWERQFFLTHNFKLHSSKWSLLGFIIWTNKISNVTQSSPVVYLNISIACNETMGITIMFQRKGIYAYISRIIDCGGELESHFTFSFRCNEELGTRQRCLS